MIEYIKNAKAYKLQNRHISSRCGPGQWSHNPICRFHVSFNNILRCSYSS